MTRPATGAQPDRPGKGRALVEVAVAFVGMHLLFRLIKRFTTWGRWEAVSGMNFSPGAAMIVLTLGMIWYGTRRHLPNEAPSFRKALGAHGLQTPPILDSARAVVVCLVILGTFAAVLTAAGIPFLRAQNDWDLAVVVAGTGLVATALVVLAITRLDHLAPSRIRTGIGVVSCVLIAVALIYPLACAWWQDRPLQSHLLTMLWVVVGAGFGEEIFFRGYVQSRLNHSFGRPWRFQGVAFGPGLLIAAAAFGLVHALNPVDYFAGSYPFAWQHGLLTCAALYYGFLREHTDSILAPALVHGCIDLGIRLP